jgi:hypothetical protein
MRCGKTGFELGLGLIGWKAIKPEHDLKGSISHIVISQSRPPSGGRLLVVR